MNGNELFLLGRRLMKIGEDAIARAGYTQLPTSVRSVLVDVFEHRDSSIGEIAARTGFPQSHVSASIARLRAGGALVTTADPKDQRRTLVRQSARVRARIAKGITAPIDGALADALGGDARRARAARAALEALARQMTPAQKRSTR